MTRKGLLEKSEFPPLRVTLRDGRSVTIRAVRLDDGDAMRAALEHLSAEARYSRFMGAINVTPALVERAVRQPADHDRALVAVAGEGADVTIVGGARYVGDGKSETCEFAIAISDGWRRAGLASRVMRALITDAATRGLKRMEGYVLASNRPMLDLARRLHFEIGPSDEGPSVQLVRLDLARAPGAAGCGGDHMNKNIWILVLASCLLAVRPAVADEGGVSFWLPGQFGSFAAVPGDPGWSLPLVYYHSSVDADASKSFRRGRQVTAGLDVQADLFLAIPTYVFAEPVLGGQASVSVAGLVGRAKVGVNATLTGPGGGMLTGAQSDSLDGVGDLYPSANLKWNRGVHNYMTYAMAGVPVGSYSAGRLANLGTNHWSVDAGGGYTYLDPKKGHEFSAVLGFTYNFENPDTNYKNGTSGHLDWAASQFLSEQTHVGLVGYFYHQLTGDSGAGATLGDFKSRVSAVGPQVGYFFPVGGQKWYVNLKGYYEFDANHRPEGWNMWLTLAIPISTGKK